MYLVYKMLNIIWEGKFELNKKSTNIFQFYTDECNHLSVWKSTLFTDIF